MPEGPGYRGCALFRLDECHDPIANLIERLSDVQPYAEQGVDYLITKNWAKPNEADSYSAGFIASPNTVYEPVAAFKPTIPMWFDPYSWRLDHAALARVIPSERAVGGPHLVIYQRRGEADGCS